MTTQMLQSTILSQSTKSAPTKTDKLLVAAIDFGTTYSGYAFCFKHEYQENPPKISTHNWVAGSRQLISEKAPTCVLCKPDRSFHSFGYEAEDKYSELSEDEEHTDWFFFRRFKMVLHNKKMHRDVEIEDDKGKKMKAKDVFSMAIKYLKDHLLEVLEKQGTGLKVDDIHWVLTVPAIWTDSAKQFMREAAQEAGIDGGILTIALEPEVASIFCHILQPIKDRKYMVIDLGGGTADITVHERLEDGTLKEVHKPSGGPWGGTRVDEAFNQLVIKIVGASVFTKFCDRCKSDQLDVYRELETKKRTIKPKDSGVKGADPQTKITVKVPVAIASTYEEEIGEKISEAIKETPFHRSLTWVADKLRMEADFFRQLFKECIDCIVKHLKDLAKKPEVSNIKTFLMVGGFSESALIQDAIRKAFPGIQLIIPKDAGLAVVKGAVLFGHMPQQIKERIAKYSYGINISPPFDPAKDPQEKRVVVGGVERCKDTFKKYIEVGESVRTREARTGRHVTIKENQKEMLLKIYASPEKDPRFVTDKGCELLGKIVVKLPDTSERLKVEVRMMFGDTEMMVEASEQTTREKYTAFFDFM